MSQAGAVGAIAGFVAGAGFVLSILGGILSLIDRRFDDPPEQRAGRKLLQTGLALLAGGAVVLLAVVLTAD